MREICKALKKKPEMLACEYLDKKRVFGDKASIDEMSSFKSKVKKQNVEYDPDEEKEKENTQKAVQARPCSRQTVAPERSPERRSSRRRPDRLAASAPAYLSTNGVSHTEL